MSEFKVDQFVVYKDNMNVTVMGSYPLERTAKAQVTRLNNKGNGKYKLCTIEQYNDDIDIEVVVAHLINGNPCKINKSQLGSVNDPSTEKYFTF